MHSGGISITRSKYRNIQHIFCTMLRTKVQIAFTSLYQWKQSHFIRLPPSILHIIKVTAPITSILYAHTFCPFVHWLNIVRVPRPHRQAYSGDLIHGSVDVVGYDRFMTKFQPRRRIHTWLTIIVCLMQGRFIWWLVAICRTSTYLWEAIGAAEMLLLLDGGREGREEPHVLRAERWCLHQT